jgi:hypothetical protein
VNNDTYDLSVSSDADSILDEEMVMNPAHALSVSCDRDNGDIYLKFSSRLALHEFAKRLIYACKFERDGWMEFYPLSELDGAQLVVDGVRLSANSSRMFVGFPADESI